MKRDILFNIVPLAKYYSFQRLIGGQNMPNNLPVTINAQIIHITYKVMGRHSMTVLPYSISYRFVYNVIPLSLVLFVIRNTCLKAEKSDSLVFRDKQGH